MTNREINRTLLNRFYTAFREKDIRTMSSCYAERAVYEGPVFRKLKGDGIRAMWHMLVDRESKGLSVSYKITALGHDRAKVRWNAVYIFEETWRTVHHSATAEFIMENGKIVYHKDRFNLWKWASMAFGIPGMLLGWAPFFQKKIRQQAKRSLEYYLKDL